MAVSRIRTSVHLRETGVPASAVSASFTTMLSSRHAKSSLLEGVVATATDSAHWKNVKRSV